MKIVYKNKKTGKYFQYFSSVNDTDDIMCASVYERTVQELEKDKGDQCFDIIDYNKEIRKLKIEKLKL